MGAAAQPICLKAVPSAGRGSALCARCRRSGTIDGPVAAFVELTWDWVCFACTLEVEPELAIILDAAAEAAGDGEV